MHCKIYIKIEQFNCARDQNFAIFHLSCLPESVVVGRAEYPAVVAEADLLDEALARVGLLQEVGQPPHVPVDLEPARGVGLVSLH